MLNRITKIICNEKYRDLKLYIRSFKIILIKNQINTQNFVSIEYNNIKKPKILKK